MANKKSTSNKTKKNNIDYYGLGKYKGQYSSPSPGEPYTDENAIKRLKSEVVELIEGVGPNLNDGIASEIRNSQISGMKRFFSNIKEVLENSNDIGELQAVATVVAAFKNNAEQIKEIKDDIDNSEQQNNASLQKLDNNQLLDVLDEYDKYLENIQKRQKSKKAKIKGFSGGLADQLKGLKNQATDKKVQDKIQSIIDRITSTNVVPPTKGFRQTQTLSTFIARKVTQEASEKAAKIIYHNRSASTKKRSERNAKLKEEGNLGKSKYYKESPSNSITVKVPIIAQTDGNVIGTEVKGSASTTDEARKAVTKKDVEEAIDSLTAQSLRKIRDKNKKIQNIKNDAAVAANDLNQNKAVYDSNKIVFIDFENTYEEGMEKYDDISHAPVTVGISDGVNKKEYLITTGSYLQRTIKFLTDQKLKESREHLAKKIGLGKGELGADGKIQYKGANGKVLTEEELGKKIETAIGTKIDGITAEKLKEEIDNYSVVYGANTQHDIGLYNYLMDVIKKPTIDVNQTGDIFEELKETNRYASGYDVSTLAHFFLTAKELKNFKAHGAGDDAYVEALIYRRYIANKVQYDQMFQSMEEELESNYRALTGKSAKENNLYTEEYKKYHARAVKQMAINFDKSDSELDNIAANQNNNAALKKIESVNADKKDFMTNLSGEIKKLSDEHLDYAKGITSRKRVADMTGRKETEVRTYSLLDRIEYFYNKMAQLGYYVQATVEDDHGVGKIHFSVMKLEDYNRNPDLIDDKNYATMFDITLAGKDSVIDKYNENSVSALYHDYYTNDIMDKTYTQGNNAINEAISLAEEGKLEDAKQASSTIKWAGTQKGDYGVVDYQGKSIVEDIRRKNPTAFEKKRMQYSYYTSSYIGESLRNDEGFLDVVLNSMVDHNGRIDAKAIDPYNLDSNFVRNVISAMNWIYNHSDDEIDEYLQKVRNSGVDVSKDLVYQILSSDKTEGFRKRLRESKAKGINLDLTGLSINNIASSRVGGQRFIYTPFQGVAGQRYSEGWVKTQPTGEHTKKKTVDELKQEGWNSTIFRNELEETSDDLIATFAYLPAMVINEMYKMQGMDKSSSDEQFLMSREFADTLEGVGAETWSDEVEFEAIKNLGIDIEALKGAQEGDLIKLKSKAFEEALEVNKNFIIPKGGEITEARKTKNGYQIHYRQPAKVNDSTKLTGMTARGQASVVQGKTKDLTNNLHKAVAKLHKEGTILDEQAAELHRIINQGGDIFVEALDVKRAADTRINAQYVAAAYQNIFRTVDDFRDAISDDSQKSYILNDIFKIVEKNGIERLVQQDNFDWETIDYKKYGFNTVEEAYAYVNSIDPEKGLLADVLSRRGLNLQNIKAIMSTGRLQLSTRGGPNFVDTSRMGGVFGEEATDVNEAANFRGTLTQLRRANEELESAKERIMESLQIANDDDWKKFKEKALNRLIVKKQEEVNRANAILDAAKANNRKKDYDALINKATTEGNLKQIGFFSNTGKENYLDVSGLDFEFRPEDSVSFTKEEWEKTGLSKLYNEYDIGNGETVIELNIEEMSEDVKQRLKDHGITRNIVLGLGKDQIDSQGKHILTDEQRSTLTLLNNITKIINGEEVNDKFIATTYQNKLVNLQKGLVQSAFSVKAANSGYLHTGKASLDAKHNWITEETARGIMGINREAEHDAIQEYIDILGNFINDNLTNNNLELNGKGLNSVDIDALKIGDKNKLLSNADQLLSDVLKILTDTSIEESVRANLLPVLIGRSPFLTSYSTLFNDTIIKGEKEFRGDMSNYKDNIYLTKKSSDALKADWDGDIISYRVMLGEAITKEDRDFWNAMIEARKAVISETFNIFKDELESNDETEVWDSDAYQEKLNKSALAVTKGTMGTALENIVLTGNQFVGQNNYTNENFAAALSWYNDRRKKAGESYGAFDLATSLYQTVQSQLGQQVGISAKQMGALLLDSEGHLNFTPRIAKQVFDMMDEKVKKEKGWENEEIFIANFADMFAKSIQTYYSKLDIGKASVELEKMKQAGLENSEEYKELESLITVMAEIQKSDKLNPQQVSNFFNAISNTKGVSTFFKEIYSKDNIDAIREYTDTEFTNITGLHQNRVNKKHDRIDSEEMKERILRASDHAQKGEHEQAISESSILISEQLSQLIELVEQLVYISSLNGQGGGKGKDYIPNLSWQKNKEKVAGAEITATQYTEASLNKSNHTYAGGFEPNIPIISATQLASGVLGPLSESDRAQIAYYKRQIENGEEVKGVNLAKLRQNGFQTNSNNLPFMLMASSLVGDMLHIANEAAVQEMQNQNLSFNEMIGKTDQELNALYDSNAEYMAKYDQLVKLFGGDAQLVEEFIKTRGTTAENLRASLSQLKTVTNDDVKNIKATEQSLGTTLTAILTDPDTKEKIKKKFNLAATLDNIITTTDDQGNITGFASVDYKNKKPGAISPNDAIEGLVQQALLVIKAGSKEWVASQLGRNKDDLTDEEIAKIQENTQNNFTEFLKVSGGEAILQTAGWDLDNLDINQMLVALLLQREDIKNGKATSIDWQNLPIAQIMTGKQEVDFDKYLESYKEHLSILLKIEQIRSSMAKADPNELSALQNMMDALTDRRDILLEEIGWIQAGQEKETINKFTNEQQNELDMLFAEHEIEKAKAQKPPQDEEIKNDSPSLWESLGDTFLQRFFNLSTINIANIAAQKIEQTIRKVISTTEELNACLVDIKIATGYTTEETQALLKEYNQLAKQVGKTTKEVAQAANDWLRAGYEGAEATQLITASMYLSTLGMMDSGEATKALISILKGWKISSEEVINVVDKLVTVDMSAAVSAGDIASAMSRVNYSAQSAGVSMDTLIGILTVGQEVSQRAPQEVGNAWRTVLARIQNVKSGKFSANFSDMQSADYDESDYEALNDVETTLKTVGINLRDSSISWRNTEEVLNEIAKNWGTYDNITQSAIANAMAATRQREQFILMMSNWDSVQQYAEIAANSYGTATQKMEAYTNSIEAAKNRVTTAWEDLSLKLDLSGIIMDVINFGTGALTGFFKIVEWIGEMLKVAWIPITAALVTGLPVLAGATTSSSVGLSKFALNLANLGNSLTWFKPKVDANSTAVANNTQQVNNNSTAQQNNTAQVNNNSAAQQNNSSNNGSNISGGNAASNTISLMTGVASTTLGGMIGESIGRKAGGDEGAATGTALGTIGGYAVNELAGGLGQWAGSFFGHPLIGRAVGQIAAVIIEGIVSAFTYFKDKKEQELLEKAKTELQEAQNEYTSAQKALTYAKTIDKLSAGVDQFGKNIGLTEEEYAQFLEANNELGKLMPGLIGYYDENGNSIIDLGTAFDDTTGKAKTLADTISEQITRLQKEADEKLLNEKLTSEGIDNVTETVSTAKEQADNAYNWLYDTLMHDSTYGERTPTNYFDANKTQQNSYWNRRGVHTYEDQYITGGFYYGESVEGIVNPILLDYQRMTTEDFENKYVNSTGTNHKRFETALRLGYSIGEYNATDFLKKEYVDAMNEYKTQVKTAFMSELGPEVLALLRQNFDYSTEDTELMNLIESAIFENGYDIYESMLGKTDAEQSSILQEYIDNIANEAKVFKEENNEMYNALLDTLSSTTVGEQYNARSDLLAKLNELNLTDNSAIPNMVAKFGFEYNNGSFLDTALIWNKLLNVFPKLQTVDQIKDLSLSEASELYRIGNQYKGISYDDASKINYFNNIDTSYLAGAMRKELMYQDLLKPFTNEQYEETKKKLQSLADTGKTTAADIIKEFGPMSEDVLTAYTNAVQGIADKSKDVDEATQSVYKTISTNAANINAQIAKFGMEEWFTSDWETGDANGLIDNFKELKNVIDEVADSYDKLKSAQEEYNQYGKLSLSTVLGLLATNEKFAEVIDVENGEFKLNANAQEIMTKAQMDAAAASVETYIAAEEKELLAIKDRLLTYDNIEATGNEIDANIEATHSIDDNSNALIKENYNLLATTKSLNLYNKAKRGIIISDQEWQDARDTLQQALDSEVQYHTEITADSSVVLDVEKQRQADLAKWKEMTGLEWTTELQEQLSGENAEETWNSILQHVEETGSGTLGKLMALLASLSGDASAFGDMYDFSKTKQEWEKIKDLIGAINKEFQEMVASGKDFANAAKSISGNIQDYFKGIDSNYYSVMEKLYQQELSALSKSRYYGMSLDEIRKISDDDERSEALDVYTEIQDLKIKLANLNDEEIQERIDTLEIWGSINDEIIEEYKNLVAASDTIPERIEREKNLNDKIKERLQLTQQILEYEKSILEFKLEYESGNSDTAYYNALINQSKNNLKQQLAEAETRVQNAYSQAYIHYIQDENNTPEVAAHRAMYEDSGYREAMQEWTNIYKAYGDLIMEDYNNKADEIQRRMSILEDSKPQEWASDWNNSNTKVVTTAITKMKGYYAQLRSYYQEQADLAQRTLLESAKDLTDAQIKELTDKYKEALKSIKEAEIAEREDVKDYQESVYNALVNEVGRYKEQLEKQKELVEDTYNKEIDKLNDKNDAIDRTNKLLELQQNLLKAVQEKERVYRAGIGWVYETPRAKVKQAEDDLKDFYLQDSIDDLNNAKDAELEALNERIKNWDDYLAMLKAKYEEYNVEQEQQLLMEYTQTSNRMDMEEFIKNDMLSFTEYMSSNLTSFADDQLATYVRFNSDFDTFLSDYKKNLTELTKLKREADLLTSDIYSDYITTNTPGNPEVNPKDIPSEKAGTDLVDVESNLEDTAKKVEQDFEAIQKIIYPEVSTSDSPDEEYISMAFLTHNTRGAKVVPVSDNILRTVNLKKPEVTSNLSSNQGDNLTINGDIVLENCDNPAEFWSDVTRAMSNRFNVTKNKMVSLKA